MASHERLKGVIVPVITPFLNEKLDEVGLENVIKHLIAEGVHGIFVLGTTGEFQFMSDNDKKRVIDLAGSFNGRGVRIFAGTTGDSLQNTIELSQYAEQKDVDAVVIAPRYKSYILPAEYVIDVMKKTQGSIVLYNNPQITNSMHIDASHAALLLEDLKLRKRLIGLKDSSRNQITIATLIYVRDYIANWFSILQGSESAIIENPYSKVDGFVPGSANFDTKLFLSLYDGLIVKGRGMRQELETLERYALVYRNSGNPLQEIKQRVYEKSLIRSSELAPNNIVVSQK